MNRRRSPSPRPMNPPALRATTSHESMVLLISKHLRGYLRGNPEEHRTSNAEHRMAGANPRSLRRSKFDVRRSMFVPRCGGFNGRIFISGNSLPQGRVVIPRSLAMLSAVCVLSLPMSVLGNEVEEKQ